MSRIFCSVLLLTTLILYGDEMRVSGLNIACEEDFDGFNGTLAALPDGFSVSADGTNVLTSTNDFRGISDGGESTGGCYAWDTEPKFSPGFFMLNVLNASGSGVNEISISYDVVCLNNADRSSSLVFEASLDGISFFAIDGMTFVSPAAKDEHAAWARTPFACDLCLQERIAHGRQIWFRWYLDDAGGSSSRDEYGIDNVRIVFHHRAGTVIAIY